jgi:2-polyprenyl-3-methyl-5-hydroxy-6-metoxy-1,4-benzoquinol methylase
MKCRICENESHNILHLARDMRRGIGGEHEYIECSNCGCIQIRNYPPDIEVLYPPEYYAHQALQIPPVNPLRNYLRTKWIDYGLNGKNWMGRMLNLMKPVPQLYRMFGKYGIEKSSAILDIGCGNGTFLFWLSRAGFKNLVGIDPYVTGDVCFDCGPKLFKKGVEDIDQQYDLITLNHSFEHMKAPASVLKKLFELLKDVGLLVISIPVVGYAWRIYGVCWVGLEPPWHFYLHTSKSFQILCSKAGFYIVDVAYNSHAWQFVGSELNRRNISEKNLNEGKIKLSHLFTKQELVSFKKKAVELNKSRNGDQAFFFLKKIKMNLAKEPMDDPGLCK